MPKEFFRSDRVSAQIQRELADLLRTEVKNPALGMITLSDVEVTRDMSLAKAYVSLFGGTEAPQQGIKLLNLQYAAKLRQGLSGRLRLRVMPELRFVYDDSIDRGMKMDALLHSLAKPDTPDGEPEGGV